MDTFFGRDFPYGPFQLFGTQHLIAIAALVLANLALIPMRKASEKAKRNFRYFLAALLIVDELCWHAWNIYTGQWSLQTTLPLHLCSVFVFLSAYMLISKNYHVYELAYFLGIGGALQAYLTPDLGQYAFPHFRYFQVFISHGSIITAAIYMTVVEGFRPTWKSMGRVALIGNIYLVAVFFLNLAIGSNYLFVAHKPETASLMDALGPWPLYVLELEAIAGVMFVILYIPFIIKDALAKKKSLKPTS